MERRGLTEEKQGVLSPFWRLVLVLLFLGAMLGVWLYLFINNWLVSDDDLPVALHSPLSADYSPDAIAMIAAPRINLLGEALKDEMLWEGGAPAEQMATLVSSLRTPVFTVTPFPGATQNSGTLPLAPTSTLFALSPTAAAFATAAASPTADATLTLPAPTVTATTIFYFPTATPGFYYPTNTPVPPTAVLVPTRVHNATATPMPPTQTQPPVIITETNVPTQPPAPTNTVAPPTVAPPTAEPTVTRVPPTDTPVPAPTDYPPPVNGTAYPP